MPTPDRTSLDDIVRAGRDILDSGGLPALTMQAVADRVGVRAPSLYKRVRNRDDLVRRVASATARELGDTLAAVADPDGPDRDARIRLGELARALRVFAQTSPAGYRLVFAPASAATQPDTESLVHAVAPLLRITAELSGPEHELEAARTVTAWANGFITMELSGAFRLGGDVDRAFEFGIDRLAVALAAAMRS
ncbi:MAG: TetR/AcrR family transcriptional regulator [Cellulomonadaceae bacterium]